MLHFFKETVKLSSVPKILYFPKDATTASSDCELNSAVSCICYPVYKTEHGDIVVRSYNDIDIHLSKVGRDGFEELNSNTSYYYSIKLSLIPPFDKTIRKMQIEGNNLIINTLYIPEMLQQGEYFSTIFTRITVSNKPGVNLRAGVSIGAFQTRGSIRSIRLGFSENNNILKSEILKPQAPNLRYNPKLNGQNFKELVVTAASGDSFIYDIQKIVEETVRFRYSEPIQPEITRYYLRLDTPTGLYLEGTDKNYTGLIGSVDNSIAFVNDQYSAFIANNKNFFMQSDLKIATSVLKSASNAVGQIASGQVGGAAMGLLTSGLDTAVVFVDRSMTVNNMRNAPSQMKNANGSVIFNRFAADLGLYVEKYSALDGDLKTANDFMNLYGFSFDSIANVKDYVHIRKYYNYIKAQLQGITGNISNTARNDLRQRFASGIRFWNQDEISYQYENYELWLED